MNLHTTYRESLPSDPEHIDNIVEGLFYQMLFLELHEDIDSFLDLIDFPQDQRFTRPKIKQKLWHRTNIIGIRP